LVANKECSVCDKARRLKRKVTEDIYTDSYDTDTDLDVADFEDADFEDVDFDHPDFDDSDLADTDGTGPEDTDHVYFKTANLNHGMEADLTVRAFKLLSFI
jgi:uncharacterized protein YjbI with pentapeptide repeats